MRSKLLKEISAAQFALIELKLYLDTHPCDKKAVAEAKMAEKKYNELVKEFEEKFGPLTFGGDMTDFESNWVSDPWPWEKEAN